MKYSKEQIKLFHLFKDEYINNGYLYGGSFPMEAILINEIFSNTHNKYQQIHYMIENGILQVRNCKESAYELTKPIKKSLIELYNLKENWLKDTPNFREEIEKEIDDVYQTTNNKETIDLGNLEDIETISDNSKKEALEKQYDYCEEDENEEL